MSAVTGALFFALAAAPLADVAPFAVKRQTDGSLEYAYDLTAVKAAGPTADAIATHGEEKTQAFLQGLPRSIKLTVSPGATLEVGSGRAVESGRLATSFSGISDGPMASDNPLAGRKGARLVPALDSSEPHLLLSAEAVAFQVYQLEQGALAALELDSEPLRRELWTRVLTLALKRHAAAQGDAREGALALAARVAAASACLDKNKVTAAARADADVSLAIDAELSRLTASPDALLAPAPWSWRPELSCAWIRRHALEQPFERTRGGTAAVLTFLDVLAKEPRLNTLWERLRSRRNRFLGAPAHETILAWREQTGGKPGEAIDTLNEFIEALPFDGRDPPPLLAAPVTPFQKFLGELAGAERVHAFAELATAVQDGRVTAPLTDWPSARDGWLAALCQAETNKSLRFDGAWRDRLQGTFATLLGAVGDSPGDDGGPQHVEAERSELKVRLLVPPDLEVEPLPELYARAAQSLERLVEALGAEQLNGLQGLSADGQRTGPVAAAARAWIPKLKGLAVLANPETPTAKEVPDGRRFAAAWRSDPGFAREVRVASASPVALSTERQHAAIVGVSRRELVVTFARPPKIAPAAGASGEGFEFAPTEQRYIVPVLVTVGANAAANRAPMDPKALRALVDGVGRDAAQAEGAFAEALKP